MSDIIHLLPDSVANQIAAGEVIQRPASVVKELVENAIDAEATVITISIKDAGRTLIQVIDNGKGMSETDARMAFERHATSKILNAVDLFNIHTKGFRGEALASIAAIAQVVLKSKPSSEETGTEIVIEGSELKSQEIVACASGSNFMVRNLFFNVPARRKFLKSNNTEFRHIMQELTRVSMAHENIEFKLIHNEQTVLHLPVSNSKQRIINLMGKHIQKHIVSINNSTSIANISGFIGTPDIAKKSYGEQYLFVNNRYMKHPAFHKAIMNAYHRLLQPDTIPSYFIYFDIAPESIDVNIHPTKTEIKFESEQAIFQILEATIKEGLGKSNMAPSIDFDTEGVIGIPTLTSKTEVKPPEVKINYDYNPFSDEKPFQSNLHKTNLNNWDKLYEGFEKKDGEGEQSTIPEFNDQDREIPAQTQGKFYQVKGRYIVTQVKSGIMFIDQKRAYERILFEQYIQSFTHQQALAQQRLYPETLELSASDYKLVLNLLSDINQLGFDVSDFGNQSVVINACPAEIDHPNTGQILHELLNSYKANLEILKSDTKVNLAQSLAKAASSGFSRTLQVEEMQALFDSLFACSDHNYCPSGKKIVNLLTMEEIDKRFS